MGDIQSKDYTPYLQGSSVIPNQANSSNKNNIVLMNPEIHLHRNQSSSTDSSNNERIKKLQEEMKIKQNEIDLERKMRESEEQRRHAEHLFNEKLIREKDCQIEDQNKILNWHVGILTEQKALLEKVYQNREETNRMENGLIGKQGGVHHQQRNERQTKRWKKHQGFNKYSHNHQNKMPYSYGHRSRSKSENALENCPMELWEFDGMKWIQKSKNSNNFTQNNRQVSQTSCNKQSCEPRNKNSVVQSQTNVPVRGGIVNDAAAKVIVSSTLKQTENTRVYDLSLSIPREAATKKEDPMSTLPNNISISFDEREIRNRWKQDTSSFPHQMRPTK